MSSTIIDETVILRYLLDDDEVLLDYQLYPNTSHIHPHMCG